MQDNSERFEPSAEELSELSEAFYLDSRRYDLSGGNEE